MPWMALAAGAISAAPGLIGGSKGNQGPRNISFENVNSDPWSIEQYNNANSALIQQQNFLSNLNAQNGIQNQTNVYNQQQQLAGQLQQQAMGQGPNPALAQLANSTGQNAAQQAAMMGSQRGTSANAGLIARQAGMQGGALQQQAAGQGAALQAQQQIAAQQALSQHQTQMGALASNQIGQQANTLAGLQQGAQNLFGTQSQNVAQWNNGQITAATGASTNAAQFDLQQNAQQNKALGGLASGLGSAMQSLSAPQGKAQGGTIHGPASSFAQHCLNMRSGGNVPGQASVPGNSEKNDTVPAMLSPGEVVIDRETLASKGEVGKAARFVQAYINKRNRK